MCDSIYITLLHQLDKTKYEINARKDLKEMDIKPQLEPDEKHRKYLPPAPYTLMLCQTLLKTKVSEGYCSNFSNIVLMEDCHLQVLKSHDCHTLMQQLLPLAIQNCLQK